MTATQTPLECALALAEARGYHSALISHPSVIATHSAMREHVIGPETVMDAALRIITEDHRKQARKHAETSAMCAKLHLKLTAALEELPEEAREAIRRI